MCALGTSRTLHILAAVVLMTAPFAGPRTIAAELPRTPTETNDTARTIPVFFALRHFAA